jgi:preprotein translocase subunit SecE
MPPPRRKARATTRKGCSSIGRASVSKTEGWGFETLRPCQIRLNTSVQRAPDVPATDALGASGCRMAPGKVRLMAKYNPVEFIQEVRQEASKVTWPTWKEVWITTLMVLIMVSVASVFFLITDQAIGWLVQLVLGANR